MILLVMVSPDEIDEWKAELLTVNHNGGNEEEIHRVLREHPGEKEAVIDGRVLGALAPFRCTHTPLSLNFLN